MTAPVVSSGEDPSRRTGEPEAGGAAPPGGLGMPPDEMLALAHKVSALLVERIAGLPEENAWEGEFRQALDDRLAADPPEDGRPAAEVVEQAAREILPYSTRLDHPRCFGFVPSSPTWPGVLADFIAAGYNFNQCTWLVASGPSHVELLVIDWFRRWIGYPQGAGGLLTSGGSAATVNALVAARETMGHPERAALYMSDQTHSAVPRAALIVGIRRDCVRSVASDAHLRLDVDALARRVTEDRAAGFHPIAVSANAGTTSSGTVDPLEELADFCEREGLWLHVDAAYGGFAVVTEQGKRQLRGIERADSIGLDAHKWFFQPYEAGCLLVKDPNALKKSFAFRPDVLQDTIWGRKHPNFADFGLQLSRSARALKIWMSVQTFGMAAFRRAVAAGLELAARAQAYVRASLILESMNDVTLGIVCFRVNPKGADAEEEVLDQANRTVLARMFWDDRAFMSSTMLRGNFALRMCIINHNTTWDDVRETLETVERYGEQAMSKALAGQS